MSAFGCWISLEDTLNFIGCLLFPLAFKKSKYKEDSSHNKMQLFQQSRSVYIFYKLHRQTLLAALHGSDFKGLILKPHALKTKLTMSVRALDLGHTHFMSRKDV